MLHSKIDQMDSDQLRVLNDLLRQIELDVLLDRLNRGFDQDREEGRLANIAETIANFRARTPYR